MRPNLIATADEGHLRWIIPFSISIIWGAAPIVVSFVVTRNARAGVYGISDAIPIPIGEAVYFFLLGLPYFTFFTIAAFKGFSVQTRAWHFTLTLRELVVSVIFLFGVWLLVDQILYWWSWNHKPIVAVYSLAIMWLVWVRPMASLERDLIPPPST